jgi:hypothetical protein
MCMCVCVYVCMCVCVYVCMFFLLVGFHVAIITLSKIVRVSLILRNHSLCVCVFTPPHPQAGKQKAEQ